MTGLASHFGYCTSRMKCASRSLSISGRSASFRSAVNRCVFCFTGHVSSRTDNLCSITSLGTPGISDGLHEKTSMFARRKVMSVSPYLGSNATRIWTDLVGSVLSRLTVLSRLSGLAMTWTFTGRPLGSAVMGCYSRVSSTMSRLLLSQCRAVLALPAMVMAPVGPRILIAWYA